MQPDGPLEDRRDDPSNRIDEAYKYFSDRFREWVHEEDEPESRFARVETLRVTLTDLLKLVSITLERGDNAQVIFETLNARGTPLLALDLVKNAVFHQAAEERLDVETLYEQSWKPQLDQSYWREPKRQGRLFRARGELFLMHWLGMKLRRVIAAGELFTTFRRDVLTAEPRVSMNVLIPELTDDAATLRSFDTQPEGSVEKLFFERLEALDVTTVMPLALLLFTEGGIAPEVRRRSLQMIESWLVRRTLTRLTTKNYNQEIASLLAKVAAHPGSADSVILEQLSASALDTSRWPSDEELTTYLLEHDAYNNIARARLVMVLAAVERSLRIINKAETAEIPHSLSLEHLIPQRWEKTWPLPPSPDPERRLQDEAIRRACVHRLGNLTITGAPLNSKMSNGPWHQKRKELNKATVLLVNSEILDQHLDGFDEVAVDRRTLILCERIADIWPGPDSAKWDVVWY
jgi:hypothetical protein